MKKHIAVLKNEVIENLDVNPAGTYVDVTLGAGGHAMEVWGKLHTGTFIGMDADLDAIKHFAELLGVSFDAGQESQIFEINNKKLVLAHTNFTNLSKVLGKFGIESIDGLLADLGWSTDQLESIPGLSFQAVGVELDMRLDQSLSVKAKDLLNSLGKNELVFMFDKYADIRGNLARKLVDEIINRRKLTPFHTTDDFNSVLTAATRVGSRTNGVFDLAARAYQALRIAVNLELSSLQSLLDQAWGVLRAPGRLLVITFHSGEEKVVSEWGYSRVAAGSAEYVYPEGALYPSVAELRENISARSAKLWVLSKIK